MSEKPDAMDTIVAKLLDQRLEIDRYDQTQRILTRIAACLLASLEMEPGEWHVIENDFFGKDAGPLRLTWRTVAGGLQVSYEIDDAAGADDADTGSP